MDLVRLQSPFQRGKKSPVAKTDEITGHMRNGTEMQVIVRRKYAGVVYVHVRAITIDVGGEALHAACHAAPYLVEKAEILHTWFGLVSQTSQSGKEAAWASETERAMLARRGLTSPNTATTQPTGGWGRGSKLMCQMHGRQD